MKKYLYFFFSLCVGISSCRKEKQIQPQETVKKVVLQFKELSTNQPLAGILVRRGTTISNQFFQKDSLVSDREGKIAFERSQYDETFMVSQDTYFAQTFVITGYKNVDSLIESYDTHGALIPQRRPQISGSTTTFEINLIRKIPVKIKIKQLKAYPATFPAKWYFYLYINVPDPFGSTDIFSQQIQTFELSENTLIEEELIVFLAENFSHQFSHGVTSYYYEPPDLITTQYFQIASTTSNEILVTF